MTVFGALQIPDFINVAARAHPAKVALTFESDQWTFAELERAVAIAAGYLRDAKSSSRASVPRFGILSSNRPGYVFAAHASARAGVSLVPLNWRQSVPELAWQIEDAQIGAILVDDERMEAAEAAVSDLPIPVVSIAALEQTGRNPMAHVSVPPIELEREAAVIYTSGTSGRPRGTRITYGNLLFSAIASSLHLGHDLSDAWLAVLQLFHIGGLSILFRGAIGGTRVDLHSRFDRDRVRASVASGLTLASLVPTMLERLVDQSESAAWAESLRCVLIGGAPASIELLNRCADLGIPVAPTYGLTETSSQVSTLLPEQSLKKPGSSGRPLPTTDIRIVEQGNLLGSGENGEIEVRGPTLFAGYLGHETNVGSRGDGWFATGDNGYLDDEGYLYVVDRRQDMIVSGGENIYPAEVEQVLLRHPFVSDAGVFGAASDTWGARPVAAVVWCGSDGMDAVSILQAHCRDRLAAYKVPDRIVIVNKLPRSPSGKLLRRILREEFAT